MSEASFRLHAVTSWKSLRILGAASAFCCALIVSQSAFAVAATPSAGLHGLEGTPVGSVAESSLGAELGKEGTPLTAEEANDTVFTRAEAAAQLDPAAVTYYVHTYNVSEAVARERLESQAMAPNLQTMLESRVGSAFTELWFDNTTGQWVVETTSPATDSAVGEVFANVGLDNAYRIEHTDFNQAEMLSRVKELTQTLPESIPPRDFTLGISEGHINVTIASGVSLATASAATNAPAAVGNKTPVRIERSSQASLAGKPALECTQFPWCSEIVGGVDVFFTTGWRCSAGFYVRSPGDPYPLILTAGHCDLLAENYGEWGTCNGEGGCGWYGHQIPYYYYGGGGGDGGLLEDDLYGIYAGYVNWSEGHNVSPLKDYETKQAKNGLVVCLHGATAPGGGCGTIVNNDASVTYEPLGPLPEESFTQMIEVGTGFCLLPGDSGGAVALAAKETAVGTGSGFGGPIVEGECKEHGWVEPINREVEQFGIVVEKGKKL